MKRPVSAGAAGALCAACACALLGACAVGPDYRAPAEAAPPAFAAQGAFDAAQPPLAWWRLFADPDLTALVERAAGGGNPDLRAAQARIRVARARLAQAGAAYEPSVSLDGQLSRDRYSRNSELFANIPFPHPQVQFTDYRAGFDASWEIDLFGHTGREVEAAQARLGGAQADERDLRIVVAAEVAKDYIELRLAREQVRLAQADADTLAQIDRLVRLRRGAGDASDLEVERAAADLQAQRAALDAAQAQAGATLDALAVAAGVTPQQAADLVAQERSVPAVAAGSISVGLPSELLRRRPDVRRAERDLASATADIGAATADLYPRFQLVGNFGADSIHPGQFGAEASRVWSLGPQLYLPVFGRDRLTAEVRAREAARDAAVAGYEKSVLAALADAESAMIGFDRARERADALDAAWREQQSVAALVRLQSAAGRSSAIELLQAEHQARLAQEEATGASAARATGLVALYKALGGGWDESKADIRQSGSR
jgi:NodT family efflux transporter outer membrane factor (OMF) lipoprotein